MNRRFLLSGLIASMALSTTFTSCEYNDDDLWESIGNLQDRIGTLEEKVNATNSDLQALKLIVQALQNQVTITSVNRTESGYEIHFSDGQTATISNGVNGTNAPIISVTKGDDGLYYWTLDGKPMIVDGKPVCASGKDGTDALAPHVRINPDNKEWEISTDGGNTWITTGVKAEGSDGMSEESIFAGINTSDDDYITFTLADGTEIKVARFNAATPLFAIAGANGTQSFFAGETLTYTVEASNISDYSIAKPDGWIVRYTDGIISITAPEKANVYAEKQGNVAFNLVSASGKSLIAKISVEIVTEKLRILTFEDIDARFTPYTLGYCDKHITKWSDLIDSSQYGGPMLYGGGMGMDEPYYWYDEGNTELKHTMPGNWGSYSYWGGGHAISNYYDAELSNGDFTHQLSVYCATGGHNGSKNFAMHYGYRDDSGFTDSTILPALEFGDGKPRVIDHIYVMWNTYLANSVFNGNSLSEPVGPDGYVKIIATGYDGSGNKSGELEYFLAGPDGNIKEWTKWDLSQLGTVSKVEFNMSGNSDNGYGFSQPAYFAYDDVAVRFTE